MPGRGALYARPILPKLHIGQVSDRSFLRQKRLDRLARLRHVIPVDGVRCAQAILETLR